MQRLLEILLLLVVCYLAFFTTLKRHDYIKTEALRAIVVDEMLERDGLTMPTVHHTPYLKKPPLYAWITTLLARQAGGLDEQLARLPSAVCGTLFVLLMYLLGERWIGRDGGLTAGAFALLSPTIADYAVRAELDLPFSFFCAVNMALTLTALRARGVVAGLCWLLAYAAALTASMWKGPHVLIFMWLTLLAYGGLTRSWRFLKSPAQWIGLAATLGVLVWWTAALSAFAGPSTVGRSAALELLVRLVPHKAGHLVEFVTFLPMLVIITLPASAFMLLGFRRDVRTSCGLAAAPATAATGVWPTLRNWWRAHWAQEHTRMMVLWLVPSLAFMLWAPAKAPRYSIPLFPPIFLLAALVAVRLNPVTDSTRRHVDRVWRVFFGALAAAGIFGLVRMIAGFFGLNFGLGDADAWRPWAFLAVGGLIPLTVDLVYRGRRMLRARLIVTLAAILGLQPVLHDVWWPLRVRHDTQRPAAEQIDETVPAGTRLFVLGDHEYHDTAIYAATPLKFAASLDDALAQAGGERAYAICPADEVEELTEDAAARHEVLFHFDRLGEDHLCLLVQPAPGPATP